MFTTLPFTIDRLSVVIFGFLLISTGTKFCLIQYLLHLLASILQATIGRLFLALEQTEDESSGEGSKGIQLSGISQVKFVWGSINKL